MATELSRLIIASYEGEYLDTEPAIPELLIPEVKVLDEGLAPLDEANPIESLKTDDTSSIESSGDIQQAAPENKASAPASIRDTRLFHGGGHAVFNSGSKYTGAFSLGFMHGKGVFNWKSGLCYEGDFDNNSITGEGAFTWSNGSKYTGHVKNGLRNGHGVFECSSNGEHVQYDGEWKNAKLNGFGKLVYNQSGTCFYEGTWLAGLKHGKGTMHYISGNIYKGEWYHNIKQGHGKMIWFDRGEEYQGHWANGLPHGYGVYTWKIARAQAHQLPVQNKYEGEWVQGKRNGFGVFTYASGANYSGEWRDNLKHGKGSCIFENGRTFIGEFKNDRPVLEAPRYQNELPFIFSLKGICPPNVDTVTIEENLKSINTVILRHIDDLRQIYSYYSSIVVSDDNESLDNRAITRIQLWKFFEDCGLRQRGHSFVALDRAYVAHLKDDPLLEGLYKDPHNVTHHFIFRDFLDVILRISFLVYKGTTPSAFSMHEYGPAASFNHMIKADVLGVLAKRGNAIARASAAASAAEPVAPGALEDVDEDMIGPVADSMTESNAGALLFVEMERKFSAGVYELYSQLAALHFRETVTIRILLHFLNDAHLIDNETGTLTIASFIKIFEAYIPDVTGDLGSYNLEFELVPYELFVAIYLCLKLKSRGVLHTRAFQQALDAAVAAAREWAQQESDRLAQEAATATSLAIAEEAASGATDALAVTSGVSSTNAAGSLGNLVGLSSVEGTDAALTSKGPKEKRGHNIPAKGVTKEVKEALTAKEVPSTSATGAAVAKEAATSKSGILADAKDLAAPNNGHRQVSINVLAPATTDVLKSPTEIGSFESLRAEKEAELKQKNGLMRIEDFVDAGPSDEDTCDTVKTLFHQMLSSAKKMHQHRK